MTHYEERLQRDLDALRARVADLASRVNANLHAAVKALLTQDHDLAYRTILRDHPVNRLAEDIEADAHRFIARHLPSAGHLRFVSSVMRIAILLERMGDYATTIGRETVQLKAPLEGSFRDEVQAMAEDAFQMFEQAMRAFSESDVSLARGTMGYAAQVDRDFSVAYKMLVGRVPEDWDTEDLFGRLVVITQLERVSDQAKNLCEETVFALTGQTKQRRPVRILFLDRTDAGATKMAVAVGRRMFGDRGEYRSAGSEPSAGLDASTRSFLDSHGFDLSDAAPAAIDWLPEEWGHFDVVIALEGTVTEYVEDVPFHTVALEWELPASTDPDETYRFLAHEIGELIETMRGPSAAS